MGFLNYIYCQYPCGSANTRFVIAFLCFFGMLLGYCQRTCLSIAITVMVDQGHRNSTCPAPVKVKKNKVLQGGTVTWSEQEQGLNLSAFFAGYIISHVPAGILCDKYGPRYPLLIGYILSTVSTGLIPLGTQIVADWWLVFILRIFTGVGQGSLIPAISSLISRWIPPNERTTVGAVIFASTSFGLSLGPVGTGLLMDQVGSWPFGFYIWAVIGFIYCGLCVVYVFSDPRTDPHIQVPEFEYLQQIMTFKQESSIPWKAVLTDKSMYGIMFVQMGHDFIIFTLSNNFAKYLSQVLGLPLIENGLVSLIFVLLWVSSSTAGLVADILITKKNVNVTLLRKLYTSVSNMLAFVFFLGAILCECNTWASIACFAIAIFFKGLFFAGAKVNIVDISLNHSGLMMSIINGIGAIAGFLCSYIIGAVAPDNTFEQWRIVCYLMGGWEAITLALYLFMSTAQRSPWDYSEGETHDKPPVSWWKQLSDADHEERLVRDARASEERKKLAEEAKAKLRANRTQ